MKILIYDWTTNVGIIKLIQTMEQRGWVVKKFRKEMKDHFYDEEFERELCEQMEEVDAVFSYNFYPAISRNCYRKDKKYISYCYDSPLFNLYSKEVQYDTNYIFVFDADLLQEIKGLGIKNLHYLPMAANMMIPEVEKTIPYQCEVSFVGQLYDDNLYRKFKGIPDYLKGFIEGVMSAQKKIYGASILKEAIPSEYMDVLKKLISFEIDFDRYVYMDKEKVILSLILEREISCREREDIINIMAEYFDFHLYTFSDTSKWPKIHNLGGADYDKELGKIYQTSKINLNITVKNIHHGVPLRVFDILSVGGFCISNYQVGIDELFEIGTDLVVYDDYEDLINKVAYYLEHEDERLQIAENGRKKVMKYHTYVNRLDEIEKIVFGS